MAVSLASPASKELLKAQMDKVHVWHAEWELSQPIAGKHSVIIAQLDKAIMLLDKAAAVNVAQVAMAHPQGFLLAYCVLQVSIIQQQACKPVLHALQELPSM